MSNFSLNSSIPTNNPTSSKGNCTFVNEEFLRYVPGLIIVPSLMIASFAVFVTVFTFHKSETISVRVYLDTELVTCSHSGLTLEVHYIYGS